MRYTNADVRAAFGDFILAADRAGISGTDCWRLRQASPDEGSAFRVVVRDSETGGLSDLPHGLTIYGGRIGGTRAEAIATLRATTRGLDAARVAREAGR